MKSLVFLKRVFFSFCAFLVWIALLTVLMFSFLPKEFMEQYMKEQSEYDLAIFLFCYIAFFVSYFVIIWFEKLLKNKNR